MAVSPATAHHTYYDVQLVFDTNILVDAMTARGPYYQHAVDLLPLSPQQKSSSLLAQPLCLLTLIQRHSTWSLKI